MCPYMFYTKLFNICFILNKNFCVYLRTKRNKIERKMKRSNCWSHPKGMNATLQIELKNGMFEMMRRVLAHFAQRNESSYLKCKKYYIEYN